MATAAPITGAPTRAPANVVPFQPRSNPLAYAPGVPAFDRSNPAHVRAWNTMIQMAIQADQLGHMTGEAQA